MKKALSFLLVLTLLLSAVSAFPFNTASAQEAVISETDTYIPEEEYTEEIYEGTGSLEYAFDGTFIRDYVDNEMLDEAGHVARINEEEELNTYVFLNRDGTKSVYFMDDNVRYVDENGETVEKDLSLVRKNKGYSLKASDVKLWFPDVLSDGISVKYDKFHLTLYPQGVADTEEVFIDEYGRLTYPGVFGENTVLAYTPTLSGLKEDIILSEYTGQLSYDFLIHTHGMRILEEEGKYIVKKPGNGNKETFELGAVQIYDSAGNFCVGEMKITEQNNGSKYILTLIAPEEFLTDPDTVYPVTIDPTIEVSDNETGAGAIEDSVIYSGTPNSNYGGFTYLTVGYGDSTYGVGRAVFRLNALNTNEAFLASTADNILSATFHTWDGTGTTGRTVNLYELGSYMWTESGITWNNCPSHVDTVMSSASLPGAAYSTFDITNLVKQWRTGTSAHFGFILINPDETNSANKKVPCSSETAITDRRPYAVVTYTLTSTINSTADNLCEDSTLNLSVTSDMAVKSVVWSSSNTSVATVTSSGASTAIATGIKAGNVIITANITFTDNNTLTLQKVLYVRILDGVYRIQNKKSNYYLHVEKKAMTNLTNVYQYSESGLTLAPDVSYYFRQMWKVYYLGDGLYSVRPLYKLNMALDVTGNNVDVYNIGTIDDLGSVPNYARWTIGWDLNGYVFKKNGSSDYALQIENESTSLCANVVANPYTIANTSCKWTLVETSAPDAGVLLYNTATGSAVNTSVEYVAPKESRTLSALKLDVAFYSDSSINQEFYWDSSDTDIATVNSSTGAVTGVSPGQVTITGRKTDYPNLVLSFTLIVTEIPNGTYYFRNWENDGYMQLDDNASNLDESGVIVERHQFVDDDCQKWELVLLDDGYYKILSKESGLALSVPSGKENSMDVNLVQEPFGEFSRQKWKFIKTTSGAYKIIAKSASENNKDYVICVNSGSVGANIQQDNYINNDSFLDEWLLSKVTTIEDMVLIPQEGTMWCWAAAAKMASYAYMETPFSVGALVWYKDRGERVLDVDANQKNTTDDVGATAGKTEEILAYILGTESMYMTYSYGNSVYSPAALQNMLDQGYPVIVCWNYYLENTQEKVGEHAIVVYGYDWSSEKNDYVYSVYNPSPKESGAQETLTYAQLYMGQRYVPRIGTDEQVLVDCYWTDMVVFKVDGYNDVSGCPLPTTD